MIFKKTGLKRKKGFTLIEILAVIIILGILIIIAVPAVTKYIENSRRSALIDTAKQVIAGARNYVNSGNMSMYSPDTTYYLPISCFKNENKAKSINGDFTVAYVGVVYTGSGYNYYWTSVDEEGEGIRNLTAYDELTEDVIESGIKISDIDTSVSVGGRTKTLVYNNDCTQTQENQGHLIATFDANDGEFSNGKTTNILKFALPLNITEPTVKYSHTQNINDSGTMTSNYGNNWGNANITGTDRGNTSQAHVVTIPGAEKLHVRITFSGESTSWDWACMWKGKYPNYTAYNDCSSSLTGKLGGGSYLNTSNTKEYDVDGDSVTFSFRSDGSGVGDGYGYYAVVSDQGSAEYTGTYEEPKRDYYFFDGWENDGNVYKSLTKLTPTDNVTYKALWKAASKLIISPNSGYLYVDGVYINSTTEYYRKAGEKISYTNIYRNSVNYSNGTWTITYNSNGGSSTPSSRSNTVYYTCNYTFNKWNLSGDCENVASTANVAATYEFPDEPGDKCTMSASWNSSCGSNWAYSYTLPSAPTRTGYRFLGWKSSATGAVYAAGSSFSPTQSETLTAQWEKSEYTITLDANGGSFANGASTSTAKYVTSIASTQTQTKYSHTQNINDSGYKSSSYGNNWTNANIRGTGRTSSNSQAHVVTIPNAPNLKIEIYYNGESTTYDWVTIWAGSHPSYTAYSNYSSGITNGQKLGGYWYNNYTVNGYSLTNVGKKIFGVNGDTVTFGFRSDGSVVGDGFGYYAIITGTSRTLTGSITGYTAPTNSGYTLTGWKSSADNQIYTNINSISNITSDITLTAQWESDNSPLATEVINGVSSLRNVAEAKRYYGSNPNNYVSFNGELWRIIGVYGDKLKIIRSTPLSNQNWDNNNSNMWSTSSVNTYLNTTYYSTLSSTAKNMIYENGTWYVGVVDRTANASEAYNSNKISQWNGKVGLVSTYEYLYSYADACLNISGGDYNNSSCGDGWIFSTIVSDQNIFRAWTMTPDTTNPHQSLLIYQNKAVDIHWVGDPSGVTPVVYLKPTVKISGGDGSSSTPYVLR